MSLILQLLSDSTQMSQTNTKSHIICQITQQSEKYNITNSSLLVLADNLKAKTDDKDDFSDWLPSINSVIGSLLN